VPVDAATLTLTLLALVAFASNSILTRLAVGGAAIDAATFTAVRLASGAVALSIAVRANAGSWSPLRSRDVAGPIALIVYAVPFSLAYVRIGAAVGALVLFGAAQITMVAYGIWRGERPRPLAWVGLMIAFSGLAALTLRSGVHPDATGVALMSVAGAAWGAYSIAGRTSPDPVAANARNFLLSAPLALFVAFLSRGAATVTVPGLAAALVSGVIASGGGYIVWYRAVRRVAVTQAAVAQLSVPVLAGVGAVLFLGEPINQRLVLSGAAVLGGIALVLVSRSATRRRS
jgi:drug/metabolite transporter (DMT)-like permease